LSETILSTNELKDWLEKETGSVLTPVQIQAQKYRDETQNALQSLSEASKVLFDSSQKEIEKRNMKVYNRARALNKLANFFIERLKKLKVLNKYRLTALMRFQLKPKRPLRSLRSTSRTGFRKSAPSS
jgi:hypothetical protein